MVARMLLAILAGKLRLLLRLERGCLCTVLLRTGLELLGRRLVAFFCRRRGLKLLLLEKNLLD